VRKNVNKQFMRNINRYLFIILFCILTPILNAQTNAAGEELFNRRIVWSGGEYTLRFAVQVDRLIDGLYQEYLREFTTERFIEIQLPLGSYRFRILPHDVLDRPQPGTQWFVFDVRPRPLAGPVVATPGTQAPNVEREQTQVISVDDYNDREQSNLRFGTESNEQSEEQITNNRELTSPRFNTLGVSVGSTFTDPLMIATLHGTFSPVDYMFVELGCDVGFGSLYDDVESLVCFYPFAHLGLFLPLSNTMGLFVSVGGFYMIGNYTFSYGETVINLFGLDVVTGINIGNVFNLSYTLRTDFNSIKSKVMVGLVYRF